MITLTNKELESFVMFELGKVNNKFKINELKKIKKLNLNPINIDGIYKAINIEELTYFPNLEYLTISNMHIDIASFAYILRLENLNSLIFISCTFEDLSILSNLKVKHIGFNDSKIDNFGTINRINNLKELSLIDYQDIDLSYFFNLKLKSLDISYSSLKNENDLSDFIDLEKLMLNNTNIINLGFLNNYKKLKELYITKTQMMANKDVVSFLIKNKVKVIIDKHFILGGEN